MPSTVNAPSWRDAKPEVFWLDRADRPAARPALEGRADTDLVVVGGGFCGLWTALRAKERDPDREVLLVEGDRLAWAATGRNGGFCEASLTHGEANGRRRFPREMDRIEELGRRNLDGIEQTVERYGIDCGFARTGTLTVATEPYQVADLAGDDDFLDAEDVRGEIDSPTYLAGAWARSDSAILDPARLAWGLAAAAERLGVRIVENTRVEAVEESGDGVMIRTTAGEVHARHVALATNAFRPLLRRLRFHTVPVYDYVLVTEPLSADQLAAVGWSNRQGVSDSGNQFHYYRLTDDDRILWGGYDAIYHYGRKLSPSLDQRDATFEVLAEHFAATFPQLDGIGFTHRWGGAIDTCTRFFAFHGRALHGKAAYSLGFTGLGVGATRFAADVMLDLLDGATTERTRLRMVRRRPLPFPPEPLAWIGIQLTRRALAAADASGGRRNLWLRCLDRFGLGFDS